MSFYDYDGEPTDEQVSVALYEQDRQCACDHCRSEGFYPATDACRFSAKSLAERPLRGDPFGSCDPV